MGHFRQEVALGLTGPVRSFLFQLQNLRFVSLPLLLHLHFFHAAGDILLIPVAQEVEQRDQGEDDRADEHIHRQLLPVLGEEFLVADGDDDIPLVEDRLDEDGARFTENAHFKVSVPNRADLFQELFFFVGFPQHLPLAAFIRMGDDQAAFVDDKTVALFPELQLVGHILDAVHGHIQGQDVFLIRQPAADGNDDIPGLGIEIGRDDDDVPGAFNGGSVPGTLHRIVTLRRHPGQAVQILPLDVAVEAGVIGVELGSQNGGFLLDIIQDFFGGAAFAHHMVDGIRRDAEHAFVRIQIIDQLCLDAGNFILADFVEVDDGDVVDDLGGIDHHDDHQSENQQQRDDQIVPSFRFPGGSAEDGRAFRRGGHLPRGTAAGGFTSGLRFLRIVSLAEERHHHGGDGKDDDDQGEDKQHHRNDIVGAGFSPLPEAGGDGVAHPASDQNAAESAEQHHQNDIDRLQNVIRPQAHGANAATPGSRDPADRVDNKDIIQTGKNGERIIQITGRLVEAGGRPHAEFTDGEHQGGNRKKKLFFSFFLLLPVEEKTL